MNPVGDRGPRPVTRINQRNLYSPKEPARRDSGKLMVVVGRSDEVMEVMEMRDLLRDIVGYMYDVTVRQP